RYAERVGQGPLRSQTNARPRSCHVWGAGPSGGRIRRWASEGQRQIASWKKESWTPTNAQSIYPQKKQLQSDGSLILIKAARDTHISAYLAKLKRLNPDWKPAVLMAKKRQTLDLSFRMEGLPNIGVPSTSLARPSLQVLKLVPTFLWEPVDLRKLHEFLKLIVKPLDRRLGYRLAAALSDSPGLFSEAWFQATTQFFDQELPRLADRDSRIEPETIESQYNFWFRRTRYPIEGRAPKSEVRKLFVFLVNWVKSRLDEDSDDAIGLNTLAAQAKRAVDLIDQVDEDEFSPLQVDRIVRTVYEAAPANFHAEQQHSLPAAFHPAAICGEISELIWWDFVQEEADYFFSNWFQNELDYLTSQSVHLLSPSAKNQRQIWSRTRPLLFTKDRLVLCIPDRISGTEVSAHPLLGELEALFGDQLDSISMHIDKDGDPSFLDWPSPEFSIIDLNPLDPPVPFITIGSPEHMHERPYESPSSIERFLYHPHQWAFQYGLLIKPSRQPELRLGTRLRGLLSHRFMERIFEDNRPLKEWTQAAVNRWVVQQEPDILRREGGLFLEYGYEPDRVQFRRQVQRAAWSLICSLRDNGWERLQSEIDLEGQIGELTLKARADLIAHHANGNIAVIDLKWRGKTRFKNLIRNREEIQLNVYAQLLDKQETSELYTAYYLLSDAQILARTNRAFTNAEAVDAEANPMEVRAEILEKLLNTYRWRKSQLASGQLEIRCSKTLNELEDAYQELDYDLLLEMKDTDAPFDDYRALIGLVQ
ncbi:MAG: PD-(D/E)XK nuclease family protein, partial [Bacteroidota bacterium]